MTRLLTKLALSSALAIGLIAATTTASAQKPTMMTVTVPFAFTADNVSFNAGTYSVQATDHFLTLRNVQTDKTSVVIVRTDHLEANQGPSRLSFNRRYGQTYLSQIWTDGSSTHTELITHPKPNRELGKATPPDATFEVATK
jgi:hypothetical protein